MLGTISSAVSHNGSRLCCLLQPGLSRLSNVAAPPAAAAADQTITQQQLERPLISAVAAAWHDSTPEHTLKRTVASYLALQQGSKADWQRVADHINTTHKGVKHMGLHHSLKAILSADKTGLLCLQHPTKKRSEVRLDMLKLLQRAMQHQQQVPQQQQQQQQQQAQQQAQLQVFRGQLLFSSVAAGSGETPAKPAEAAANAHTPTDIAQLRQLVGSLWPQASSDPAVQAKRLMADMLLAQPNLALPRGAGGRLGQLLGSAKSLGISGFNELLARDPSGCFVFKYAEVPPMIRLDPAALRQYAHKQGASDSDSYSSISSSGDAGNGAIMQSALEVQPEPNFALDAASSGDAGYQPALQQNWTLSASSSSTAAHTAAATPADSSQRLPHVTQLMFELQLQQDGSGWVHPSFILHPQQLQQASGQPQLEDISAAGDSQLATSSRLVGVAGSSMQLEPLDSSSSSSSNSSSSSSSSHISEAVMCADASPEPDLDEAVCSMAQLLPARLRADLEPFMSLDASPSLEEVIVDKGKPVVLRLSDRSSRILGYTVDLVEALSLLEAAHLQWQAQGRVPSSDDDDSQPQQSYADISYAEQMAAYRHAKDFASMFRQDGRMGVPGTLHRISVLRNVAGTPTGLTYRLGRHVPDKAKLLADVLSSMKASIMRGSPVDRAQSLLVLGKPGTGKTTLLRDIARIISTPPQQGGLGLAVLIVDTSNEIAGDADECHPCIGYARRLMVPRREQQADILVQAVQNHNPDVIIVDEIGTKQEVEAARTIAERGVVLVGTAHGNNLSNLMRNPVLRPLVGGVNAVTIGDQMAAKTNSNVKTRLERGGAATFVSLLELNSRDTWRLHLDVEQSVDLLLASPSELTAALDPYSKLTGAAAAAVGAAHEATGVPVNTQVRSKDTDGRLWVKFESPGAAEQTLVAAGVVEQLGGGNAARW